MQQDSRRDQKGLTVLIGQQTKTERRTVAAYRKVLAIVAAAEDVAGGCTVYRLDAGAIANASL